MSSQRSRRYRGRHRRPPSHRGRYLAAAGVVAVASIGAVTNHDAGSPGAPSAALGGTEPPTVDGGASPEPVAQVAVATEAMSEIRYPAPDLAGNEVPALALMAYQQATATIAVRDPGCHLPSALLAAIGKVESNHARGGLLDAAGTVINPILGPVLNGGAFAAIADTDAGRLDGDLTWDRAVGPMQFIPSTWRAWAADGNGDGRSDPENLFDASLAAGRYLCASGRDLGTEAGTEAAIRSYNNSDAYLRLVLAWAGRYSGAMTAIPQAPTGSGVVQVAATSHTAEPDQPSQPAPAPAPAPVPVPDQGSGATQPAAPPAPQPTQPIQPADVDLLGAVTATAGDTAAGNADQHGQVGLATGGASLLAQITVAAGVSVGVDAEIAPPAPACDPATPPVPSTSDTLLVRLCAGTDLVSLSGMLGLIGVPR